MRIKPITAKQATPEGAEIDADLRALVGDPKLSNFTVTNADGALIGPFPVMITYPKFGKPLSQWSEALVQGSELPERVREVIILATGSRFNAAYELYAHTRAARRVGFSEEAIVALLAGRRPEELSEQESIAFDLVNALHSPGPVPGAIYSAAINAFGDDGYIEIVNLTAQYVTISMILNAYNVPLPEDAE